jgi:glycosyltransferase involved in cell wall biosynthesis
LQPYVVHAGRFVRQKRHDILLDAYVASGIPHNLVLLTGNTPALVEMIRARGLQDRVIIPGFRSNPFPWFAHASALVLSSDFEGFGNVLVEALACGTPVVSTDCPSGPGEILTGSLANCLCPPGDAAALGQTLRCIVENPPQIDQADLSRFSPDRALDQLEKLIGAPPNI